ncbi:unnamed protein product [Prorocentrum cordatum]|uniref:Alpha 1,4-glycosyltransferase domain-containing protein n=1 Tax=Prorocentrum cordatum TaxID=2364126 RepID=A0ABN9Y8B2_9DINO|nr:unnamed protein product [Polarella glacialis]
MHHRPSWSILGGLDDSSAQLRVLGPDDKDFAAVLSDHPELKIEPIGGFNHWDRRECAVQNGDQWRARCKRYIADLGGKADIPKVIHQIWIGPREPPCLWIDTFRVNYCEEHSAWGFEMWSDEQVAKLPMINASIYAEERMWQCKADILRLEFLWHYGGLYVDADMVSVGNKSLDPIVELGKETGFVIAYEPDTKDKPYSILGNSVIACTPHHPLTLMLILFLKQTYHQKRHVIDVFAVTGPVMYTKCLVDCDMPISIAAQELLYPAFHFVPNPDAIDYSRFPKCLMFQFGYTCSGLEGYVKRRNRCRKPSTCPFHAKKQSLDSYRRLPNIGDAELCATVPIGLSHMLEFVAGSSGSLQTDGGVAAVVTDGDVMQAPRLRAELPGFVDQLRGKDWDLMLFGIEWSTGSDEVVMFNVPAGGRPRNCTAFGLLLNTEKVRAKPALQRALESCVTDKGFDAGPIFEAAGQISLWFAAEKYATSMEEARIWRSIPIVRRVFKEHAGHEPPVHVERTEVHGNLCTVSDERGPPGLRDDRGGRGRDHVPGVERRQRPELRDEDQREQGGVDEGILQPPGCLRGAGQANTMMGSLRCRSYIGCASC